MSEWIDSPMREAIVVVIAPGGEREGFGARRDL